MKRRVDLRENMSDRRDREVFAWFGRHAENCPPYGLRPGNSPH